MKNKFKIWYKDPFKKHRFVTQKEVGISLSLDDGKIYCNCLDATKYYDLLKYTGEKDRNGNEIYEGDVLKVYKNKDEFEILIVGTWIHWSFIEYLSKFRYSEIIGNQYEGYKL